jgi:NADPH:quinone reductase-like Zn-dependent oxidoreductase
VRQVSFDHYGGVEVLELVEAEKPEVGDGELLVAVRATGINPFDFKVRRGLFDGVFPIELPTTQGTDVAGVIEAVGSGVEGFVVGDEVLGSDRPASAGHRRTSRWSPRAPR